MLFKMPPDSGRLFKPPKALPQLSIEPWQGGRIPAPIHHPIPDYDTERTISQRQDPENSLGSRSGIDFDGSTTLLAMAVFRQMLPWSPTPQMSVCDPHWSYLQGLLDRFPDFAVYSGAEPIVPQLVAAGGAGTISGTANVIPDMVRDLCDATAVRSDSTVLGDVRALVSAIVAHPVVPALRRAAAYLSSDEQWERMRASLVPVGADGTRDIERAFAQVGIWPGEED